MADIVNAKFELINTHEDYIEFVLSYSKGLNHWRASGIGWIKKSSPRYYLRQLRLNGVPVSDDEYKKANIVQINSSYKFKDKKLDALTVSQLGLIFGAASS